jgi:two-component system, LytTR family, response regulator
MKYIISDPDEKSRIDLKKILDDYEILDFKGSFKTQEATINSIQKHPPDIAFIRMGKVELNAFELNNVIHELNQSARIIFLSSDDTYAIDAFECGGDGFLRIPLNREKIKHLLISCISKKRS